MVIVCSRGEGEDTHPDDVLIVSALLLAGVMGTKGGGPNSSGAEHAVTEMSNDDRRNFTSRYGGTLKHRHMENALCRGAGPCQPTSAMVLAYQIAQDYAAVAGVRLRDTTSRTSHYDFFRVSTRHIHVVRMVEMDLITTEVD